MTKLTLTAKLAAANARIAELETKLVAQARDAFKMLDRADDELARMQAKFAEAESARLLLAVKAIPSAPTTNVPSARAAYLARRAEFAASQAAERAAYLARCAAARELAMRTGRCVRID